MLIVKMHAWNREPTQYKAALQLDATAIGKGPIRMYIRTLPHWNYARLDSTGKSIKIVLLICCHSPTQPNSSLEWQICRHFHATAGSFYAKHVMHSKTNFEVDFLNANFFLPTKNDKFRMVGGELDQIKIILAWSLAELVKTVWAFRVALLFVQIMFTLWILST